MQTGTVKWFSDEKGYGFIAPADGGKDIFVHWSAIESGEKRRNLKQEQRVEFEVVLGEKGPYASSVRVIT